MAPEVLVGLPYVPASADIFAAGYILFTIYSGLPPFNCAGDNFYKEILNGNLGTFWARAAQGIRKKRDFFSESFKNLINSMLHPDPDRRATIATILQDPWYLSEDVSTPEEAK